MTVQTLEELSPKTVRLPGWYLDAAVRPGQSRRVDLAYARTDMRSQGRTERRALLALDGAEDLQGGYVQLTRSTQRTDLYLTVGPEPLDPDDERPHPSSEPQAPEELLAQVLGRDGSKTLATDTPDVPDVRRLSTAELRAERDRLARLRAECPPDRSRELRLATQRAREAEQVCQQARADQQAAAEQVAALAGTWRRRELAGARERLVLADHALRTTSGQADQAAERLGVLRRAQQRHLGWMEANHDELRVREAGGGPGGCLAAPGRPARGGPGPAGLAAGRARPRSYRPRRAGGVAGGGRGTGWLSARLRPGSPWAGEASLGASVPGRVGGCAGHWDQRGAGRREPRAAGPPQPRRRRRSPRRPPAAADRRSRSAAPGQPRAAAGRRAAPAGPRPPPRLAAGLGRARALGRLGPPPRPP
jgi:hypothetical protein